MILWVKGYAGVHGNERADRLASRAAERVAPPGTGTVRATIAFMKGPISENYNALNDRWLADPNTMGARGNPAPPPKKSCLDRASNRIARMVAQICTDHWRSAVFLKRIRKRSAGSAGYGRWPATTPCCTAEHQSLQRPEKPHRKERPWAA